MGEYDALPGISQKAVAEKTPLEEGAAGHGCGHHLHPTAGTIFHRSSTSLRLWYHAMYLMTSTRCGISAKQLERELGVHYKTAWRMFNKIRNELMNDEGESQLRGDVEVDETSWGGKPRNKLRSKKEVAAFREDQAGRAELRIDPRA